MAEKNRKCFKCGCSPAKDNVKLFRFPKPGFTNLARCELWAQYIFPEKAYSSFSLQMKLYNEHRMLCQNHFKDTDFYNDTKQMLIRTAVPCDTPVETTSTVQETRQEDSSCSSPIVFAIGEPSTSEPGSPISANERALLEASPEAPFQQTCSPPEDHNYSQSESAQRATQRLNQDINVPSWAELEIRRLGVKEQQVAALERIAESVNNIDNNLARIARFLESRYSS